MTNKPTTADRVWGRSLLLGHVHAFSGGSCRCGAKPFGNRPADLNKPETGAAEATVSKVVAEQSRKVA